MQIVPTELPGVLVVEPRVFGDSRGAFWESFRAERFAAAGLPVDFPQDNVSISSRDVLRGLHLQHPHGQGKLVSVLGGEIFDVAVDVRVGSPTFARWVGVTLSLDNRRQLWIPPGFAHGFCVLSPRAVFHYKCTDVYHQASELGVAWDDPDIGVDWPLAAPLLSEKDARHPRLAEIPKDRLPTF
jgi:dTDP-4-dehydrorhamnose 3,5-epimerase